VIVSDTVTFVPADGAAKSTSSRFARELESDEQVYQRTYSVGPDWKPLDLGWLREVGASMVVVENREGRNLQRVPFPDELLEIAERIVEIGFLDPLPEEPPRDMFSAPKMSPTPPIPRLEVLPGESFRGTFTAPETVVIRARNGRTVKVTVTAVPR